MTLAQNTGFSFGDVAWGSLCFSHVQNAIRTQPEKRLGRSSAQQAAALLFTIHPNPQSPMAFRITANLPATLERPLRMDVRKQHYPSESDYGLGVILWDVYSRQPHTLTGPLMKLPRWEIEAYADTLAQELGFDDAKARVSVPYRYTVTVPLVLGPSVKVRIREERYRSSSAYVAGLIFFSLKERGPKGVPHHKCAPLLREPDWIRRDVFSRLAQDFDNPDRKWPKDLEGRINELITIARCTPPPEK